MCHYRQILPCFISGPWADVGNREQSGVDPSQQLDSNCSIFLHQIWWCFPFEWNNNNNLLNSVVSCVMCLKFLSSWSSFLPREQFQGVRMCICVFLAGLLLVGSVERAANTLGCRRSTVGWACSGGLVGRCMWMVFNFFPRYRRCRSACKCIGMPGRQVWLSGAIF